MSGPGNAARAFGAAFPSHGKPLRRHRHRTARGCTTGFRVLHFSVQRDHLLLLVEADEPTGFERGMRGLTVRVAKAVNRALGRKGRTLAGRYHARSLRTPREVRNVLVYVLNNWRKHSRGADGIDPCSSARWFDGWRNVAPCASSAPVATARTWLARLGWRRHGSIGLGECPRAARE